MSYVDAGYAIALGVLFIYSLSLVFRHRRLVRASAAATAVGATANPTGTAVNPTARAVDATSDEAVRGTTPSPSRYP